MSNNAYTYGQTVRMTGAFTNSAGAATVPDSVVLTVTAPNGTETHPTLAATTTASPYGTVLANQSGRWVYMFNAVKGTDEAASEDAFVVRKKWTVST